MSSRRCASSGDVRIGCLCEVPRPSGSCPHSLRSGSPDGSKATLQKSFSGVANMFDRIGAGLTNSGASRDSVVASVLGVDEARRTLAVNWAWTPIRTFRPGFQAERRRLGRGPRWSVDKGTLVAIPGGVSTAVSSASTADTLGGTLAQKTLSPNRRPRQRATAETASPRERRRPLRPKPDLYAGRSADHLAGPEADARRERGPVHRKSCRCRHA